MKTCPICHGRGDNLVNGKLLYCPPCQGSGKINPFRREIGYTEQTRHNYKMTYQALDGRIESGKRTLDIGPKNIRGETISKMFDIDVEWTHNYDLDFISLNYDYDYIFIFDVLEHLYNPLLVLNEAGDALMDDGKMFITVPRAPHWLWTSGHFHQFDTYRFNALIARAGLRIVYYTSWYIKRKRNGIRPVLRRFLEREHFYELIKEDTP